MRILPEPVLLAIEAARVPSPPQVLLRLLQLVDDEQASIGELSALVAQDPGLATRLLNIANSAALHRRGELHNLEHCLAVLGTRLVRTIATCLSLQHLFDRGAAMTPADLAHFWGHSLLVAELAAKIARAASLAHPEEAHLVGLLHDIGQLMLLAALGKPYARLLTEQGDTATLVDRELAKVATHHGEIGAWLADHWQLDSSFADGFLFHHAAADTMATAAPLPRVVWLAHALAAEGVLSPEARTLLAALIGDAGDPETWREEALTHTANLAQALGIDAAACDFARPLWSDLRLVPAADKDAARDELAATIGNMALLQPLQQDLFTLDSDAEILLSLRESARILFDLNRIAFLFPDPQGAALSGAGVGNQPALFRQIEVPLAGSLSLPALAANSWCIRSSYDSDNGPETPIDIQFARALGCPGLLCVPLLSRQQLAGVMVCGLTPAQHQRLVRRLPWLLNFGRIAAALTSLHEAKTSRHQAEAVATGHFKRQARRIVHEAGNPLGVIKSYLKILDRKLPEESGVREELDILREEIDRVANIVCRMSELPKATGDGQRLDLGRLIDELLLLYGDILFRARGIGLEVARPDTALTVNCCRDSLKQILVNLWKNASEALDDGQCLRIAITSDITHGSRGYIQLCLDDTGPGMSEETMRAIRRPAEATGATSRGIGLSMVGTLAARQGITLTCQSQLGQGTRITLLIPRADTPPQSGEADPPPPEPALAQGGRE
ncbi:MAG: HDOD domain-containing protein [Betaproteobacteria bacterium]|nr:HDOD domain-containing protein [Betaproteobacteria bacterium]MCL2885832.1 HDOD domain-containing protein [Betaproteobacteria bacterium]